MARGVWALLCGLFGGIGRKSVNCRYSLYINETIRREGYYSKSTNQWDFTAATEADEGYFLRYGRCIDGVPVGMVDYGGMYEAYAFVNASGIALFDLSDKYAVGDVYETPERLITTDELIKAFEGGNARREKDSITKPEFKGARLMYVPVRASNKKDGMVFSPVWYVTYDWYNGPQLCDGWAWYSAVDGRLLMDCYS